MLRSYNNTCCNDWVPLATQQLRLRNLLQVLAFNINPNKSTNQREKERENESYSFTLHSTSMSAPFYTSEKQANDSPKWLEFDGSWKDSSSGATDAIVVRLWAHKASGDEKREISVWGIHLSGLTYLGQHLGMDTPPLKSHSLAFRMVGGYFTDPACIEAEPKFRFASMNVSHGELHQSYSVNMLLRLRTLQQAIKKQSMAAENLKQKIVNGEFFLNETREKTMLRRLLNKTKPKVNHQDLLKSKELVEYHKFRVQVLKEEKALMTARIKNVEELVDKVSYKNEVLESSIMERYRLLRREAQAYRVWRRGHVDCRERQIHSRAMLNFRTKQLISELNFAYPIEEKSQDKYTIAGVHLPDSEDFQGHDDTQISVALGFVAHTIQMISTFLQVPLRYNVVHLGSRSRIVDHICDRIPDTEREFPLFLRGKDKLQFNYAVYLLNKNIAQLRWLCGLPTQDLRNTLANLSGVIKLKGEGPYIDHARSLSSSTAELCGSSSSVFSPVGSVLSVPLRKNTRMQRLSESDMGSKELKPFVPRHRISKSAGSAKDFNLNESGELKLNVAMEAFETPLGRSLSVSLDKGLNEYEEMCSKVETVEEPISFMVEADVHSPLEDENYSKDWTPVVEDITNETIDVSGVVERVKTEDIPCEENHNEDKPTDDLLDDVSTRAQILADQATSFNRFKSRFKNTVETANS